MITIEVRKDGRMYGVVETDPLHPECWRWIAVGPTLQSDDAYPTIEEAIEALFTALGWGS